MGTALCPQCQGGKAERQAISTWWDRRHRSSPRILRCLPRWCRESRSREKEPRERPSSQSGWNCLGRLTSASQFSHRIAVESEKMASKHQAQGRLGQKNNMSTVATQPWTGGRAGSPRGRGGLSMRQSQPWQATGPSTHRAGLSGPVRDAITAPCSGWEVNLDLQEMEKQPINKEYKTKPWRTFISHQTELVAKSKVTALEHWIALPLSTLPGDIPSGNSTPLAGGPFPLAHFLCREGFQA